MASQTRGGFLWLFIGRSSAAWAAFPPEHPALFSSPVQNYSLSSSSETPLLSDRSLIIVININGICFLFYLRSKQSSEKEVGEREATGEWQSKGRSKLQSSKLLYLFYGFRCNGWCSWTIKCNLIDQHCDWHLHSGQPDVRVAVRSSLFLFFFFLSFLNGFNSRLSQRVKFWIENKICMVGISALTPFVQPLFGGLWTRANVCVRVLVGNQPALVCDG